MYGKKNYYHGLNHWKETSMAKLKKREDGRYQKSVIVGKKPNGKYIKKSVYGKTQKELEANINTLVNEINSGVAVWNNDISFLELSRMWSDQYVSPESEKWKYTQQTYLTKHLLPILGAMHVRDLKQIHLQTIINKLASEGYATSTMKKIKQTAEQIMRIAVDSDLIVKNPFSGVKVPSIEPAERRALTESEIDLITENWRGARMGVAAMIMLYAGLRLGEVLALEWNDIDFEKRTINVSKARIVFKNRPTIKSPKTKAGIRIIPIPEILFEVLNSVRKKKGLVCPDLSGNLMSGVSQKNAWKSYINHLNECAGGRKGSGPRKPVIVIDKITPHMLRHTYATMLFDAGVDVKSAQKFLGHSDIEVTLEIYTHLSKFKEEQAIRALDEHLKERKKEPDIRLLRVL